MDRILEARAFVGGELTETRIGLDESEGTITAVKRSLTGAPVTRIRDGILLPAAIDMHVHMRDPGFPHKEDFRTGTLAALLGGVGTVFDMPNTKPTVDNRSALEEKLETISSKAIVDFGLFGTITARTREPDVFAKRCDALKLYLAPTTGISTGADDQMALTTLTAARHAARLVAVHAEAATAPEAANLAQHDAARPAATEVQAIQRVASLASARDRLHICHATTQEAAKAAGDAGFTVGLTPHHLLLHIEPRLALTGKVNPPLRDAAAQTALWQAFASGLEAIVESDHAPHTRQEKDGPFVETPAGIPGVQTLYPLLLQAANDGRLPLAHVVEACAWRPAQRLGLRTGRIEAGHAADLVVVDTSRPKKITLDWLASKAGWSPFEGMPALAPRQHYRRAELALEDGHAVVGPGHGRRVRLTN
jgi:dihydroorotase